MRGFCLAEKYHWAVKYIELAPEKPGVYMFKNKDNYIYIGKAVNLKIG